MTGIEKRICDRNKIADIKNIGSFQKILNKNINQISERGKGKAKTVEHLWKELCLQESSLYLIPNLWLVRVLRVVSADIYAVLSDGSIFYLKEAKQVFHDAREKVRCLPHSLSEKISFSEKSEDAIFRWVQEELGIQLKESNILPFKHTAYEQRMSNSFPWLLSFYMLYNFVIILDQEQYNKNWYIERQRDKNTFFTRNNILTVD